MRPGCFRVLPSAILSRVTSTITAVLDDRHVRLGRHVCLARRLAVAREVVDGSRARRHRESLRTNELDHAPLLRDDGRGRFRVGSAVSRAGTHVAAAPCRSIAEDRAGTSPGSLPGIVRAERITRSPGPTSDHAGCPPSREACERAACRFALRAVAMARILTRGISRTILSGSHEILAPRKIRPSCERRGRAFRRRDRARSCAHGPLGDVAPRRRRRCTFEANMATTTADRSSRRRGARATSPTSVSLPVGPSASTLVESLMSSVTPASPSSRSGRRRSARRRWAPRRS